MGKKRCKVTLPVVLVVVSICYVYYTTIFIFIDRWFGIWSSPGLMNSLAFSLVASLCIFNYSFAVSTDPGRVPPSFEPDIEENDVQEIKRKRLLLAAQLSCDSKKNGDLRYCQKCSHYKPPRAHHCRVCKRCVLRMDHHCIWINNCVGHANYKIFFVFVFYAVIASTYSLVLLLGSMVSETGKDEPENDRSYRNFYVISCLLLIPLTIALSVLLVWHIYLTLRNRTTIEYYEGVRAMWLAEKGGEVYRHPYDLGAFENLISVLGPNIISWICPTTRHIGSGLRFPTAYDKLLEPTSE